jgi:hypothetical protein
MFACRSCHKPIDGRLLLGEEAVDQIISDDVTLGSAGVLTKSLIEVFKRQAALKQKSAAQQTHERRGSVALSGGSQRYGRLRAHTSVNMPVSFASDLRPLQVRTALVT